MKHILLLFTIFLFWMPGISSAQSPTAVPQKSSLIWEVTHPAHPGKLYLAGTIHACKPDMYPLDAVYDMILEKSDYLVFEIAYPSPFASMSFMIKQGFYPPDSAITLPDVLGDKVFRDLAADIQKSSPMMKTDRLIRMKPWSFFSTHAAVLVQKEGFDMSLGMEKVIQRFVFTRQMEMRSLETVASQLTALAASSLEPDIIYTLKEFHKNPEKGIEELNTLIRVFRSGNSTFLEKMIRENKQETPHFYQALIVDRNQKMAENLFKMLAEKKTGTVLVGLAHFCGDDSIRVMLKQKGCRIQDVKYLGKPGKINK